VVLRENIVRAQNLPLVTRVPSLPTLDPGTRVRLDIGQMDFLERSVSMIYRETLGQSGAVEEDATPPTS
jgi:exoribonuclease II